MVNGNTPALTMTQFLLSLGAIVGAVVATGGIRMRATRQLDQLRQAQKEMVGLSAGTRAAPSRERGLTKNPRSPGTKRETGIHSRTMRFPAN
jgi:hypothetical protein